MQSLIYFKDGRQVEINSFKVLENAEKKIKLEKMMILNNWRCNSYIDKSATF